MAVIASLDAQTDLRGVTVGGAINEDVMQKIWDISRIPLPYSDRIGRGTVSATFHDWLVDKLAAAAGNAWAEEANFSTTTASGVTDFANTATAPSARLRNHVQISVKAITVSELANTVNSVGGSGGLEYNLMVAQQELRRDMEFEMLSNNASVLGVAASVAAKSAGYAASVQDQTVPTRDLCDTSGTQGGWNSGTSIFDAYTPGVKRAITETKLRNLAQALYLGGCGGPDFTLTAMCAPTIKRTISQYMYTSSARIAQLVRDVNNGDQVRAVGSIELFQTDFGVLELVPNRFMGDLGTNQYGLYMFDPAYIEQVFARGVTTTPAAKIGLVERRIVNAYWSTRFNPSCIGAILDIDDAATMTA